MNEFYLSPGEEGEVEEGDEVIIDGDKPDGNVPPKE